MLRALRLIVAVALSGCGVHVPGKINDSGMYDQLANLDKGAILTRDTSVAPRSFALVGISTSSNMFPGRFEFLTRSALADLGVTKVVNGRELLSYAKAHPKLLDIESLQDPGALKRIGQQTGPIMLVEFSSISDGNVRRSVRMRVTDVSQGKVLFLVEQTKIVWTNADAETIYPVLNAFRSWYQESDGKRI